MGDKKEMKGSRFFNALMGNKEIFDVVKAKTAERNAKRAVEAKHAKTVDSILEKSTELLSLRENAESYDVEKVITLQESIKNSIFTLDAIKDEYTYTFGKTIKDDLDIKEALEETLGEDLTAKLLG